MTDDPRTYDYSEPTRTLRRGDEGRHHERRRLPARALRARADVPVRERRRHLGGRDRGRGRRRRRTRPRPRRLPEARRAARVDRRRATTSSASSSPSPARARSSALLTAGLGRHRRGKWLRVGACGAAELPAGGRARASRRASRSSCSPCWTGSGALAVCAVVAGIVLALLGLVLALGLRLAIGLPRALGAQRLRPLLRALAGGGARRPRSRRGSPT